MLMMHRNPTSGDSLTLSAGEVAAHLGGEVSVRSIWRWVSEGRFPQPITIGGRTLWRRADVDLFVNEAGGSMKEFARLKQGDS